MRYLKVEWHHAHPEEPITLYYEIDDKGWARRAIEFFRDGHPGYASRTESKGSTSLSPEVMPSAADIASQKEFEPSEIAAEEFEKAWSQAKSAAP